MRDALQASVRQLQDANIDEPEESVHHILAKVLNLSWETGFRELRSMQGDSSDLARQRLSPAQCTHLATLLQRRQQHEPIQYIMGQWDFLEHVYEIVPPLLCPRPETEELVLYARQSNPEARRILDVGCGTGCIGISLAHAMPDAHVTALDVEYVAVETSRRNARRILGDAATRYRALLCPAADYQLDAEEERCDLVVSNPPYIPAKDMDTLDLVVSKWESPQALCGGDDGMDVIRTIVQKLPEWTLRGGDCWMEVDPTHPALLKEWLDKEVPSLGVSFVESIRDLQGLDRFVHLRTTRPR